MPIRSDPNAVRSVDRVGTLLATLATLFAFGLAWRSDPRRPTRASTSDGWWSGFDQGHYLDSALAFAHANLSPAAHWYLPAYPALASPFVRLVPGDPFMVPDLACLLFSLWLSGGLGAELLPDWRWGRCAGLFSFVACMVAPPVVLQAWVVPWTSTLAAPLMLGCLRATLAGMRRPQRPWPPVLAGSAGAAVAGCRPVDAVLVLGCAGILGGWAALRPGRSVATQWRWLPLFLLGVLAGVLPLLLLYLAIWGPHESPYLLSSALVGFEWRLLPLHWVELMISARPVVPDGFGLIQVLPFVGTGLLGLMAAPGPGRERSRHLLAASAVAGSMAAYLSYRDLHAPGLWLFSNYHYFKWSFGLLGLYSVILARTTIGRRGRNLVWLLPLALLLACWRVAPHRIAGATGVVSTTGSFSIPVPALGVDKAVVASASGPFDPIYFGPHVLAIGSRPVLPIQDFKAFPIFGGLMITPLRPLPAGILSVRLVPGISLDQDPPPFLARLALRFGVPCWFGERQSGCSVDPLLPPPIVAPGRERPFDGGETPLLGPGWSYAEPGGRWTSGSAAELRLRVRPRPAAGSVVVTLSASAVWRQGLRPLEVAIQLGSHTLGTWRLADGATHGLSVRVPAAMIGADGALDLWLAIGNPHRPRDIFPPSRDVRPLGLFVRSIGWRPGPPG